MSKMLKEYLYESDVVYFDGIAIFSDPLGERREHDWKGFQKLRGAEIQLKLKIVRPTVEPQGCRMQ